MREVGGLDENEQISDIHELNARTKPFFSQLFGTYNDRTGPLQTSNHSAAVFRRRWLEKEPRFLTSLRQSDEMQVDIIARRPVYKEDILLLALKHKSYRDDILRAVGDSNRAHLVIFSTQEGRAACLKKVEALSQELTSCLNPSGNRAVLS